MWIVGNVSAALVDALALRIGNADPEGVADPGGWVPQVRGKRPHVAVVSKGRGRASRVQVRVADAADWDVWRSKVDPNSPAWAGAARRMDQIAALRRRLGPTRDVSKREELVAELDRHVSLLPVPCRGQFEGKWSV